MATQPALVLLMEDDVALKAAITHILSPHFRLASALHGDVALERVLTLQPDLVLCDVRMPGLRSESLLAELRQRPQLSDLPLVFLVADGDRALRWRLLRLGAQACISTPIDTEELTAHVAGLIYARQRASTELQRYEHIVATSGDMLVLIDREHRFVVTNRAYSQMYGQTPDQLRQRLVAEVLGPVMYERIKSNLDRALAGETLRVVLERRSADAGRRVLDVEYQPFRHHGEVQGVIISLRDITELKDSEEALLRQTEELASHNAELERFNRATVGRELDMIELKKQVNALSLELGREAPFPLAFLQEPAASEAVPPDALISI